MECNEKCGSEMADGRPWYWRRCLILQKRINLRKVLVSFGYRVSFKEAMKYAYIGYFFSSVTPSATGGQPLQLYAMSKDKIHVAHGTMALLTELTSFQIAAFLMENIAAFWILTGRIHLNKIMLILAIGWLYYESGFYCRTDDRDRYLTD